MGVPAFLLMILVPFITGWTFRKRDEWRDLARYSIAMTPLLVALFILMGYADSRPGGTPGLFQRLFMGTWILWMILISSRLYRLEVKRSGQRLNSRTWGAA
jgi:amino acid transporter